MRTERSLTGPEAVLLYKQKLKELRETSVGYYEDDEPIELIREIAARPPTMISVEPTSRSMSTLKRLALCLPGWMGLAWAIVKVRRLR